MSNIYIQEPHTYGKVLLKTSVGDIDIELWSRESPKACRNFVQLCMEGYYDGTIFHRLVKGFIVQGGDPNGDGTGGESIYGQTFKDEFHSRLRFIRRGLLGMANAGKNDNGSQFFFTLGATEELQNKHTIFGKVTGDTLFNMLKLEDGLVGEDERPLYPHKIIKTEILNNPFDDLTPRIIKKVEIKENKKNKKKGVKNFGLLSFGIEAEEDEHESNEFLQTIPQKGKSAHDLEDDPKLSKDVYKAKPEDKEVSEPSPDIEELDLKEETEEELKKRTERIKNKLKSNLELSTDKLKKSRPISSSDSSDDDYLNDLEKERKIKRSKKVDEIKKEITSLKRQYKADKVIKNELLDKERAVIEVKEQQNELIKEYLSEKEKYTKLKELPKKGSSREQFTLSLLSKFKSKLENVRENSADDKIIEKSNKNDSKQCENNDEDIVGDNWLGHELHFVERGEILAKDAATKQDDWYDVFDPRNPLNKRRRGDKDKKETSLKK